MKYNDTDTMQGFVQLVQSFSKGGEDLFPEKLVRLYGNLALDEYAHLMMMNSNTWTFDDSNWNTNPIATRPIISGVYNYKFNVDILRVEMIEYCDNTDGIYEKLTIIDPDKLIDRNQSITEKHKDTGKPQYAWIKGSSIFIYPTPDVGTGDEDEPYKLKVYYQRSMKPFNGISGYKLGLPSVHIEWLAIKTALLFAVREVQANKNDLATLLEKKQVQLTEFARHRNKAVKRRIMPRIINSE